MKNHRTIDLKKNGLKYFLGRGCIMFFLVFISITSSHAQWNVEIGTPSIVPFFRLPHAYVQFAKRTNNWNVGALVLNRNRYDYKYGLGLTAEYSLKHKQLKHWEILLISQLLLQRFEKSVIRTSPDLFAGCLGLAVVYKFNEQFSINTKSVYGIGKWVPELQIDKTVSTIPFWLSIGVKYTFKKNKKS